MMQSNTISQRISIDGAIDVIRQFKDMGAAGEAAIKQIQNAVSSSIGATSEVGNIADKVRAHFAAIREHMEPIKQSFGELNNAAHEFGRKMGEVGENIVPHFREVMALATAGAVAGVIELIKSTGDYIQEIKRTSEELGVTTGEYQKLNYVIRSVGLDQERFISTFTRLARSVGQAIEEEQTKILDYSQKLFGDLQSSGVQVIGATEKRLEEWKNRLKSTGAETNKALVDGATAMYKVSEEAGKKAGSSFHLSMDYIKREIAQIANDPSIQGAKDRMDFFHATGEALPTKRISEQIELIKSAGKDLDRLFKQLGVTLKDAAGNQRPLIDIMQETAKGLNRIENAGIRAFDAQLIFNRGFKEVLPLFSQGGEEINRLSEEWGKMTLSISTTDIEIGSKLFGTIAGLNITLENLKSQFILAFSPQITDVIKAITERLQGGAHTITDWAHRMAGELIPGVKELVGYIKGELSRADIKTQWVNTLINGLQGVKDAVVAVIGLFQTFISVMGFVATAINAALGTEFTGPLIAAVLIVGQLSGMFGALASAIYLAKAAFVVLWVTSSQVLIALAAFGPAGWIVLGIIAIGAAVLTLTGTWDGFFKFVAEGFHNMVGTVKAFIEMVTSAASALARLFSSAPATTGGAASPAMFSGGGRVRGSGSGDHIHALLEPEEYVVNKSAVQRVGTDFMHMLNAGMVSRFASGGIAGALNVTPAPLRIASGSSTKAGSDRAAVQLTIDGRSFGGFSAPSKTVDDMTSHARTSSIIRIGPAPSWKR